MVLNDTVNRARNSAILKGKGEGLQTHMGLRAYEVTFPGSGHGFLTHVEAERCACAANQGYRYGGDNQSTFQYGKFQVDILSIRAFTGAEKRRNGQRFSIGSLMNISYH